MAYASCNSGAILEWCCAMQRQEKFFDERLSSTPNCFSDMAFSFRYFDRSSNLKNGSYVETRYPILINSLAILNPGESRISSVSGLYDMPHIKTDFGRLFSVNTASIDDTTYFGIYVLIRKAFSIVLNSLPIFFDDSDRKTESFGMQCPPAPAPG